MSKGHDRLSSYETQKLSNLAITPQTASPPLARKSLYTREIWQIEYTTQTQPMSLKLWFLKTKI